MSYTQKRQFSYTLGSGRIGLTLSVFKTDKKGQFAGGLIVSLNKRGFEVNYDPQSELQKQVFSPASVVCDFESFEYPDDIQQSEVDFITAINGPFPDWVIKCVWMCSMLCSQWAAGHSEERLHETIRETVNNLNSD